MADYPRAVKVGTILWSVVISIGVLALGFSILLPSTKRARMDFRHSLDESATTEPTTEPTTGPAADAAAVSATQP